MSSDADLQRPWARKIFGGSGVPLLDSVRSLGSCGIGPVAFSV